MPYLRFNLLSMKYSSSENASRRDSVPPTVVVIEWLTIAKLYVGESFKDKEFTFDQFRHSQDRVLWMQGVSHQLHPRQKMLNTLF